jgi:UDP-2,3-diacylglucosamine pyrophosphatase LpxH
MSSIPRGQPRWGCRCEDLSDTEFQEATIIIAGDISDDTKIIKSTLQCFKRKYAHVFFVPGNHELWIRKGDSNVKDSFGEAPSARLSL